MKIKTKMIIDNRAEIGVKAKTDSEFMRLALAQANIAAGQGEVPVGAVVALDGQLIGAGFNQNRQLHDPSAHAEIMALRAAAATLKNHRLNGATLYVTLEPCVMCAGAILHARIERVVFAATDPRWGAAGSVANVLESPLLNHQCAISRGVEVDRAAELLTSFFKARR